MIKNILKNELIQLLPATLRNILTIDYFDEDFIQQVKQNPENRIEGITTNGITSIPNIELFPSLHHLTPGKDKLPFADNSFTLIIGENILSHCLSLPEAISELHRVLVDHGTFISAEPNIQYHQHLLNLLQGNWDEKLGEEKVKLHFFTPYSLAKLLNDSYFQVRILSPLEVDKEDSFPLSPDGYVHINRYHIGPLTNGEHRLFLVKKFLVVASKTNEKG